MSAVTMQQSHLEQSWQLMTLINAASMAVLIGNWSALEKGLVPATTERSSVTIALGAEHENSGSCSQYALLTCQSVYTQLSVLMVLYSWKKVESEAWFSPCFQVERIGRPKVLYDLPIAEFLEPKRQDRLRPEAAR